MALSNDFGPVCDNTRKPQVFRIIDDTDCVITTLDPYKALIAIKELIEKHDITDCWVEVEDLR